jgi:hypothetical protein
MERYDDDLSIPVLVDGLQVLGPVVIAESQHARHLNRFVHRKGDADGLPCNLFSASCRPPLVNTLAITF